MAEVIWREPINFAAGDSLVFQRYLPSYLPADGWVLHYVLTDNQGQAVANFTSTTSTIDSTCHAISAVGFAASLDSGDYYLSGVAINAAGNSAKNIVVGERHTFYEGDLTLGDDLQDGLASQTQLTYTQQVLIKLQAQMLSLTDDLIQESDVQRTRFVKQKMKDVSDLIDQYTERRNNEINQENVKNGRGNANDLRPMFCQ